MKIALFAFNFSESTIALAKNLSQNNTVDYYYIMSKSNRFVSALGLKNKSISKLGIRRLDKNEIIFKYINPEKVEFYLIVIPFLNQKLELINKLLICIWLKKRNYDVINLVGQRNLLLLIHKLYKKTLRFHTIHEVNDHSKLNSKPEYILKKLVRIKVPLIFHSEITKHRFHDYFPEYTDSFVLPMGTFDSYSIFLNGYNSTTFANNEDYQNTFLFYGYIHPYKGLKYFIEAIKIVSKSVKDIKGIIAGMGYDSEIDSIINDNRFEIQNHFIDDEELVNLINQSKAVICPYTSASQSGIPLTSFVFNKPVIATNLSGFREIIEDGETGFLVPVGNAESIAEKMLLICKEGYLTTTLEKNIKYNKKHNNNINWDSIAVKTIELFDNKLKLFHD